MKQKVKEKFRLNRSLYMVILAIMFVQALRYFPFKFGGWNQVMLSFSYRYGFIQRAFLGSVLDIISTICHIPWEDMRYLYGIFTVAFYSTVYFWIIYKVLDTEKNLDMRYFFKGLILAFYMGPGWVANYSNFALTDVWIQMCSILAVYLLVKEKHTWTCILICSIGVLIYTGYIFTYWNIVLVYLFYKALTQNKKYFVLLVVNIVCVVCLFTYMQLYSHVKTGVTLDYVMERTAEFTDKTLEEVEPHRNTIRSFLFRDRPTGEEIEIEQGQEPGEIVENVASEEPYVIKKESVFDKIWTIITSWHLYIQEYGLLLVAMAFVFAPFFCEIFRYWGMVAKEAGQTGLRTAWLYRLIPFGGLTVLPCYILLNDYGRYTNSAFIYEFGIIWLLNCVHDKSTVMATKRYVARVQTHKCYYIFLLGYAAINGTFQQNLINELISTVETYLWKIIEVF